MSENRRAFPYIPSTAPGMKEKLLNEVGLSSVEDIYQEIPERLRFEGRLNIPEPIESEYQLKRHVRNILSNNESTDEYVSFLGGGTWKHYVPSVCDTIASQDEFLTAYVGDAYADKGKFHALFESCSMIGDLVEMDVVTTPTYDWANAVAFSCGMAERITGRKEIILPKNMSPRRLEVVKNYAKKGLTIKYIDFDPKTGLLDLDSLEQQLSSNTAAVYFENPTYMGVIEVQGQKISDLAHNVGAEVIVGVDPSSLGVIAPPSRYGADIVCGDLQPLGMHMEWGGGLAGFIASRDEEKYVSEYPTLLFGVTTTQREGEYGFGHVAFERTSYAHREEGKDYIGTTTALYGIVAGVYLALMGPKGMKELGTGIMERVHYATQKLNEIDKVKVPRLNGEPFKEFIVDFNDTGKTVSEINKQLRKRGIFGGHDLSEEFPSMKNCALYCITEIHSKQDIDYLVHSIADIVEEK
ncbi:aminomethyl-transferring glycine dehydrogenase subunit GcvPA [Natranaerobius trueperi]|uniref:Glycine dehydrogenase (Aminomethyl-transferring) n=1 Tax=Natranaerobius trueperi TaxID=759412 RepID=A0A226BX68_9FIRM|nr:aminomethyl-transferring glycine dehydrogenase subunit GcvPA [Natranaerobius trueperi]OWZ82730.1 glycine dehydrogenase (aminomethyl-transferring) [Natranaerobius trueperi]